MYTGEKIRILREKYKITQCELSKKTNLTQSQVSKIEKGKRKITDVDLKEIAKALHVTIQELLEQEVI
ncbi:helix-turn-helix domain-containing protein [Clostridium botulinum]|uniref:helix-turn-helix domain-containing protein n=1 Tax=Clostridium botulinum TaxID=1491 RepID=UPI003DA26633